MTAEEALGMAVAANGRKIEEVRSRLADRWSEEGRRRVAIILVLASQYGAGDAASGLALMKAPASGISIFLSTFFPGFVGRSHATNEGLLLDLLSYRPVDDPELGAVLEVLERAASFGDGVLRWEAGQ